jgi:hypothetical protein
MMGKRGELRILLLREVMGEGRVEEGTTSSWGGESNDRVMGKKQIS